MTEAKAYDNLPATIHARVTRQAELNGDSVAAKCGKASISFRDLDRRSSQIAHHLRTMGASEGALVAIAMARSIELIVGLVGILKSGAAYLPLDLNYPQERIDFILSDAKPVAILTDPESGSKLVSATVPTVSIDSIEVASASIEYPAITQSAESLAYVIYTSGSTGVPKGCLVTHHNVLRLFDSTDAWFGFGPEDVWTFFHSYAFDFSVWEIWGALLYGGRVIVVPYLTSRSPKEFHQLLVDEKVTVLSQTPSAFRTLMEADRSAGLSATDLALRYVIFGGEALGLQALRPWLEKYGDQHPVLVNMYGITETTVHVTYRPIRLLDLENTGKGSVIGIPIPDLKVWLLNDSLEPRSLGESGEMYVSGAGVCLGYLNRPQLTESRFLNWCPPGAREAIRLYKTGDLARLDDEGELIYLGRSDDQVKISGFRIETGEIESHLVNCVGVLACAVIARQDDGGDARLIAYVVPESAPVPHFALRNHLMARLPNHMVPAIFMNVDRLPITENGKLDRRQLPVPGKQRPELDVQYRAPMTRIEDAVCSAFAELLELDRVGVHDNFFDLGGSSLLAVKAIETLRVLTGEELGIGVIFDHPTPAGVVNALHQQDQTVVPHSLSQDPKPGVTAAGSEVAIIGMAGRFPRASTIEEFWRNLVEERDCITRFTQETLDPTVTREEREDPDYVWARGVIENVECFDAAFFTMTSGEAEITDPQHRILLELAWECLERAGYAPDHTPGTVGVFAGCGTPSYLQNNILTHPDVIKNVGALRIQLGNDKDYIATRIAHKLNLKGTAVNVNTACSTSLVAVSQAVDSLRLGRCRMALAGAASISSPPRSGYVAQDGAMLSPDGVTRTFDADAKGTSFNDGAAIVLLKGLQNALADGDQIYAIIRGVATNNDGGDKASFMAPSVDGQAAAIEAALQDANVSAREVSYVEAHGTATPLGDPVELEALSKAFRRDTADVGFCSIGSVKSNVGHLVTAAGVAGLIKTALALDSEQLPASQHFDNPNPRINFLASPFVVNRHLMAWPRTSEPRRAGVSSFGVGGTNAHVIMQEAPLPTASAQSMGPQLLLLSAKTKPALDTMVAELADHLEANRNINLADVAYTLQHGRSRFAERFCAVVESNDTAGSRVRSSDPAQRATGKVGDAVPPVVWMLPGQGAQYPGMGRGLYAFDPAFRDAFDECIAAMSGALAFDLKARMFADAGADLLSTATTQPAIFCLEYALAKAWMARGCKPAALIGHSVGEFVAAVLSEVMTLPDAARLVAVRGALMEKLPGGRMLAVRMSREQVLLRLPTDLSLAAVNAPNACVVSGSPQAIESWSRSLETQGTATRSLQTSHAFHSWMMDPVLDEFARHVQSIALSEPRIPIISTSTGALMTKQNAMDPQYWVRHLREAVLFSPALQAAVTWLDPIFLEIGPRSTLSGLVRQHRGLRRTPLSTVSSFTDDPGQESAQWLLALGTLWTLGHEFQAPAASPSHTRRRVRLPTYAFQRKQVWLEARRPSKDPEFLVSSIGVIGHTPMPSISMETSVATHLASIHAQLRDLFEEVTGVDLEKADGTASFFELGLDSLSLTQAALHVKKHFKIALTFRQLMETYRDFNSLAAFVESSLPAAPAPIPTPASAPAASPMSAIQAVPGPKLAGDAFLQEVVRQQMQVMAQQLTLLSGREATVPTNATVIQAPPVNGGVAPGDAAKGGISYDVKKAFGAIARIHTQTSELTERQKARLSAFVRRYTERTQRSRQSTIKNRSQLADPRVVNGFRPMTKEITYQLVVNRSKGSQLWDIDGNEYIDVLNGFGMNLFGWQPDFVQNAVRAQLDEGYEIGPQHPLAGEVAELICELTGFDRAGLCNTGSEAVMAAMRIARTVTGRSTVVLFTGSYHGTFDEVLVRAGRGASGIPAAPGIMRGMFNDVRVLDYGTPEALEFIRTHADDLAAVLVEPVQSRRPEFQPREFLQAVRDITARSGTCLIFDEVITGFRAHLGGVQSLFGIRADLACYGKVIGGGFPVGVVAGARDYMDSLDGGAWQFGDESIPTVGVTYFAGTFVRHPLALAAAKASLDHLKERGHALQTNLNSVTAEMAKEINAFCREVGAPLEIRHFSSLWRVAWLEDHPLQDLLFAMMRSRGIHILDNFPCFMTTAHTAADISAIKTAFRESVLELQEADFLPRAAGAAVVADSARPPVPNAKLGRDKDGKPAWFAPDANSPGKYLRVSAV